MGQPQFDSSRAFGDLWALDQLWKELKLDRLQAVLRGQTRHAIDLEALLRVLVFNRLSDPHSKLGVVRWLETVSLPDMALDRVEHHHLLRLLDALITHQDVLDRIVSEAIEPLVNEELSVVFYDMTTVRAAGLSEQSQDVRQFGMSKEGLVARQFMLGLVQTAEGIPLYHEVFNGNTAEVGTLKGSIAKVLARFPIKRVVAVADRGLLSLDNLAELQAMRLPNGPPLEFILAVPGRRYGEFADLLVPLNAQAAQSDANEVVDELSWNGLRLVVAHDCQRAQAETQARDAKIAALEEQAAQWVGTLDSQDAGQRRRGRALSDGGARARFYNAVSEARLKKIIRVDLKSELFTYEIDQKALALALARAMDGKLLLVSNTSPELTPAQMIARYKSLADIERGFKVLKSEIELGPVHHRLPDRIRAHTWVCFIALLIHRVIRARLRAQPVTGVVSPERALAVLRRIQTHCVVLDGQSPVRGLSAVTSEQQAILNSLKVKKPTTNDVYCDL